MRPGDVYEQTDGLWVLTEIDIIPPAGIKAIGLPIQEYIDSLPEEQRVSQYEELSSKSLGRPPFVLRRKQ